MARDNWDILEGLASTVAPRLLGATLQRQVNGRRVAVKIVETEAYDQTDVASHSYRGETKRTAVMFGPPGRLYVYFTYGMHYCCNIVVGPTGHGSAVLIRAAEPLTGEELLALNRPGHEGVDLTNGPAKLCQALNINADLNGADLTEAAHRLIINEALPQAQIRQSARIGISQAQTTLWRFFIKDNPYVSAPKVAGRPWRPV